MWCGRKGIDCPYSGEFGECHRSACVLPNDEPYIEFSSSYLVNTTTEKSMDDIKREAVKEFAEKLKETVFDYLGVKTIEEANKLSLYDLIDRLCDLEDKIENGTLIELPCKVGDKVYRLGTYSNGGYIQDYTIIKIEIYEEETLWFDDSDNQIEIADFGETLFLTEAEAEAKLKELQEKK